jgi:hypothetical protein
MRRILIVSLLLAATSVHADHIWRLWCGKPLTPRKGSYDTSAECRDVIRRQMEIYGTECVDTKHGMVWKEDGTPMAGGYDPNCRTAHDEWAACECRAETVETK